MTAPEPAAEQLATEGRVATCQETHTGAWDDHCILSLRHPGSLHLDARGHSWSDA